MSSNSTATKSFARSIQGLREFCFQVQHQLYLQRVPFRFPYTGGACIAFNYVISSLNLVGFLLDSMMYISVTAICAAVLTKG
jgi:hypothetical protein